MGSGAGAVVLTASQVLAKVAEIAPCGSQWETYLTQRYAVSATIVSG
jgi:hypothetical protein